MYRLAADVFNDAAMIFDCLSPAFPKGIRVGLLCASSVLRALCGVAAGSSKASLSAHFATQNNLGELNAVSASPKGQHRTEMYNRKIRVKKLSSHSWECSQEPW